MNERPASVVDALLHPDETAAYLAVTPPRPDHAGPLSVLDPARLSRAARVDALIAIERQMAWLAGLQQHMLATMASEAGDGGADDWLREDVACALRLSGITAQRRMAVARMLVDALPATLALLKSGAISYLHALSLAEAVFGVDDQVRRAVEQRVLPRAPEQTLAEFKRSVRRAVAAAAPDQLEARREQAIAERRVCVTPRDDGMAELWALLPAEGAAATMAAVDALASHTPAGDPRTMDQRRADAFVDIAVAVLHDPLLPKPHGLRPAVQVTVALSTLLGDDDQPGELSGQGPIPASVARRLAGDATGTWRRLVTDPLTGQLIDYGRSSYRPPRDLTDHVIARDQICAFPGCQRPARRCDLDHRRAWSDGGTTSPDNIVALCRRHHRLKHRTAWALRSEADGSHAWTSPTKHRYTSCPPEYPMDRSHLGDKPVRPDLSEPESQPP